MGSTLLILLFKFLHKDPHTYFISFLFARVHSHKTHLVNWLGKFFAVSTSCELDPTHPNYKYTHCTWGCLNEKIYLFDRIRQNTTYPARVKSRCNESRENRRLSRDHYKLYHFYTILVLLEQCCFRWLSFRFPFLHLLMFNSILFFSNSYKFYVSSIFFFEDHILSFKEISSVCHKHILFEWIIEITPFCFHRVSNNRMLMRFHFQLI